MRRILMVASLLVLGFATAAGAQTSGKSAAASSAPKTADPATRRLDVTTKEWTGDFDGMLERRVIRVFVPYSRSLYFVDKGRERGISATLIREFERHLNKKYAKQLGKRPLTAFVVVSTRDEMQAELLSGHADIAVGNIKVLDELAKSVDFVAPDESATSVEVVVTGPASPQIGSIDDLSGKTVHVRKVSSYYLSLTALNERFKKAGKPEAKLVFVPEALEDEDMLEMMNAGLLGTIIVDDWKAKAWAQVLPKVKVREDIVLREKTKIGWAIRKNSPKLAEELTSFYAQWAKQRGSAEKVLAQYHRRVKALKSAAASEDQKRLEALEAHFQKYGNKYKFDPLMLAAQGYQESGLNQNAKSHVGAIGVMQIMPATGKDLGVGDIQQVEPNIHGGAKYMDQLMTKYFPDAKFDEQNRALFAFASYNCGPGNVSKMRKIATERGLDPDKWFNNVEVITAEKIGMETTTYVRNIFKYYVAYRLTADAKASATQLKEQVAPAKK